MGFPALYVSLSKFYQVREVPYDHSECGFGTFIWGVFARADLKVFLMSQCSWMSVRGLWDVRRGGKICVPSWAISAKVCERSPRLLLW